MKDKIFGVLQRVGRSFMLPIAILPVAGLLLGIGGSFSNETTLKTYGLLNAMGPGTVFIAIFLVMNDAGNIVFTNLPIIFAIGVAIGMAKKEKEVAALSSVIAFFIMHASISALIDINGGPEKMLQGAVTDVCGITSLQMGVFGGIIVGLGTAALHNRFYKIKLPQVISFFGGARFVPIISGLVYTLVGILMFFVWPMVQAGINAVGTLVLNSGYVGTWIYGFMERLLIPFGLHHVFYIPFWQTAVGGTMEVAGKMIEGAQNIFFAQLADPTVKKFAVEATKFMSGKFPLMIFGLPGAALAMYKTADNKKKKMVSGLLLSAALTSMITGITEPLEFTFLFVAPLLYGIHCVLAGLSYALMHFFGVGVGMTFSGGLIDLFLFGVLQGNGKTNWVWVIIVGIFYFIIYYFLFSFLIKKLNLRTPGRFDDEEVKLYKRSDLEKKSKNEKAKANKKDKAVSSTIVKGLGGRENISDVDCCATRLRITVEEPTLVSREILDTTNALGVIQKGYGVQVIYGPSVAVIKSDLEEYLNNEENFLEDDLNEDLQDSFQKEKLSESEEEAADLEQFLKSEEGNVNLEKYNSVIISSPVDGIADQLENVPDEAFASKVMGDGMMVMPETPYIKAPIDCIVSFVFDTKHAIGIKTTEGIDLIIHIGVDTVKLQGQGFRVLVKEGDKITRLQKLVELDLQYLKENAPSLATPVICPSLNENQKIIPLVKGTVKAGDDLFKIITVDKMN